MGIDSQAAGFIPAGRSPSGSGCVCYLSRGINRVPRRYKQQDTPGRGERRTC